MNSFYQTIFNGGKEFAITNIRDLKRCGKKQIKPACEQKKQTFFVHEKGLSVYLGQLLFTGRLVNRSAHFA